MRINTITAVDAVNIAGVTKAGYTQGQMLQAIIKLLEDDFLHIYLSHPEIIAGLAHGYYCPGTLRMRIQEMYECDNMN